VLRLRICGKTLCNLPMEHRHFHYLRQAGWYHYLIEDTPHALVALAQLYLHNDCESHGRLLPESISDAFVAKVSIAFSLSSIVFGLLDKGLQMVAIHATVRDGDGGDGGRASMMERLTRTPGDHGIGGSE
jgi:hypothetical protein